MEKLQLVNFIAKLMEESGFKVYKDFKTSQKVIDIYGVLPSVMGDFGAVVACKNYDKQWEVGIDILKEMEMVGRNLKASKVVIVNSSSFSSQARNYASRKSIKLIDRDNLMILAKKFSKKNNNNSIISSQDNYNSVYNGANPGNGNNNLENHGSDQNYQNNDENSNLTRGNDLKNSYRRSLKSENYSNDFNQNLSSSDRDIYVDDSTYISGKSSGRLGKHGSRSNLGQSNRNQGRDSNLTRNKPKKQGPPLSERIKPILSNTVVLIILVVTVSYIISYLLTLFPGISNGISGLVKILSSLVLSYGLILALDRDGTIVLVKGTTLFFVSLIILILLIIFL
ncbi:hypothetical protein ALNOE001_15550 [Candidatus Methanobinarius endosymbioticus]|uniref:Restriction endonuclease type IV Mrr domain-containing protein n=1 Tax=Candidatus Methanobinarius endosymbioticus TaxID=2006182 RepID=A0A366M9N4_9EURY|nr:hypothetical protein ALNOE001_15550 [Candidatus Methanobinarius endosymbioticus]